MDTNDDGMLDTWENDPITEVVITIINPTRTYFDFRLLDMVDDLGELSSIGQANWTNGVDENGVSTWTGTFKVGVDTNVSFLEDEVTPEDIGLEGVGTLNITTFEVDYGRQALLAVTEAGMAEVINNGFLALPFKLDVEYRSGHWADSDPPGSRFAYHPNINMNWSLLRSFCPPKGDLNLDDAYNVLDIVTLTVCILSHNCLELDNPCAADINSDGVYNVLDVVKLANCILAQTFPNCGQ